MALRAQKGQKRPRGHKLAQNGPIYWSGSLYLRKRRFADLTDVTLADEDTNSILTDHANGAF